MRHYNEAHQRLAHCLVWGVREVDGRGKPSIVVWNEEGAMSIEGLANPTEPRPADDSVANPDADPLGSIALCLSGGGYRAMVYHLGTLWRLNELGFLPRLRRVSSVSGGSITAAWLGLAWPKLGLDAGHPVSSRFVDEVVLPIRGLANHTIDIWAILRGIFGRGSVGDRVADAYRGHLFGDATLQDLPDGNGPRFVINATNLQSGVLWRFSRPYMRDYQVGEVLKPRIPLAVAVAASSAFPPFLSPVELPLEHLKFEDNVGDTLRRPPYTTRAYLTDGGVYDNLGLQTVLNEFDTILVSDGGGKMKPAERPGGDWFRQVLRVLNVVDNQVRSLRVSNLVHRFGLRPDETDFRRGAYWSLRVNLADYNAPGMLACPFDQTTTLANIPTRLKRLDARTQERLINWGYAGCDAAIRRYVDPTLPPPMRFPYPGAGVG
jgi:NTE family protein